MKMNLDRKYIKSLSEKWCMRFETFHSDEDNYDGIITNIKSDFIILREESNFEFDGVVILSKRFIKSIRDGKYDKCCNQIIRQNNAIKKAKTPRWVESCETLFDLVNLLHKKNIWFVVEILSKDFKDSVLYIGPVIYIEKEFFKIKCYDAAGKWEKAYQIDFKDIFRIEFDSKYCNHFNAFIQSKNNS